MSMHASINTTSPSSLEHRPDLAFKLPAVTAAAALTNPSPTESAKKSTNATATATSPRQSVYDAYKRHIDAKIAARPTHSTPCVMRRAFQQEFGFEILGVVPWYYDEHVSRGCDLHIWGLPGARYLYWFAPSFAEVAGRRSSGYLPEGSPFSGRIPHAPCLPAVNWTMPPWREFFGRALDTDALLPRPGRPIAMVFNKYTVEWDGNPVNFFDVDTLRRLLSALFPVYQIVYVRMESEELGDDSVNLKLADKAMVRREYPAAVLFEDLYDKATMDYNLLLFGVAAKTRLFVSVQGGTSVVASLWGAPNFIYATRGKEIQFGDYGWYGQLAGSAVAWYKKRENLVADVSRYSSRASENGTVEGFTPSLRTKAGKGGKAAQCSN